MAPLSSRNQRPADKTVFSIFLLSALTLLLSWIPRDSFSQKAYANTQSNGVTGVCVLCGVVNPTNPVDASNLNDYSSFNITLGLLGVSVYQDLIFPSVNPNPGCDSLVIGVGSNNALLSANLLGGVSVQAFNGANPVGNEVFVTGSLLRLLSGGARGEIYFRPTASFDRVRVRLTSNLVGLLDGFRIYYAYRQKTQLTTANPGAANVSLCLGKSITLTATSTDNATIEWYDAATGGNLLHTGDSFRVTPVVTSVYYAQAVAGSCSASARSSVTVNVNALPATPSLTASSVTTCAGNAVSFAVQSPLAGLNYLWYDSATGGNIAGSGAVFSSPVLSAGKSYYAAAQDNITGCLSTARVQATAVVNPTPALPVVSNPLVSINAGGTATFTIASPVTGYTYQWYDVSSGGTALATGTSYTTSALNATKNYYVEATASGCISVSRTQVTAQVNSQVNCGYATTQQSPMISGVCALCGVLNSANSVNADLTDFSTIHVTLVYLIAEWNSTYF